MINEMGVRARHRVTGHSPRRKLRSAISLVIATIRMQKMGQEWTRTKKLGDGLKRAKLEMLKRRESSSKGLSG